MAYHGTRGGNPKKLLHSLSRQPSSVSFLKDLPPIPIFITSFRSLFLPPTQWHLFPTKSQCIKWPLCPRTHPAYINALNPTAPRLPIANHLNSLGCWRIIAATYWRSSKAETNEFSTPPKDERRCAGISICVNCCVVMSKTQRPKREKDRNAKMMIIRSSWELCTCSINGTRKRIDWAGLFEDCGDK